MLNYDLKIKEIRKEKGISQEVLAKMINTKQQMISRYEMNLISPTLDRLVEIARFLEVSLDQLVVIKSIHDNHSKDLIKKTK